MSTIDPAVVRIAERRLRLVTPDELQRLGLDQRAVRRLIFLGHLHRVVDGVLSVTPGPFDVPQRELALCLSIPSAVLSHASAAAFWGLRRAPKDRVELTVPKGIRVADRRAVVHYSNRLPEHHVIELVDGARVTSVARTVFDLGGVLDEPGHLSVIDDARNKHLCTDAELGEVYETLCGRGRRGSAAWGRLTTIVERAHRPTMSELELRMQDGLVAAGLPLAIQQHELTMPNGRTVLLDLAYPDCRLAIEIDHSEWHATPSAVENDKARDLGLATLGWQSLRFTDRAIEQRLGYCVASVVAVRDVRRGAPLHPAP